MCLSGRGKHEMASVEERNRVRNECPRVSVWISIQCEDNAAGVPGVVVYGNETFLIPSQQGTAFGVERGPHRYSSVRTFQFPYREDEEPMECSPPEVKEHGSSPDQSSEEEEMETQFPEDTSTSQMNLHSM